MSERQVAPWMVAGVILAAFVVTGLLVGLSQLGGTGGSGDEDDMLEMLSGIPQEGSSLGREEAPVEIRVYEDLQCPACAQFIRDSFPKIVEQHVKPGDVRVVSETLAFLWPDSVPAGLAALAAGEQDRYWQYATLFFLNQGQENGGYVTDEFLTGLAKRTPGLDVERWNERRNSEELVAKLQGVQDRASEAGIESTPTLVVSGPNGERELVGAVPAEEVTAAIEEVS
jgi:protein-disulfide isomerase